MKIYKILLVACVFLFIFLCFFHYFSQRPLWGDERFVLNNINTLSFSQVFGPLKDSQAFPRVYLAVIKFFSQIFNYHILSLRFLPLGAMLAAFFIWQKLYQAALNPGLYLLAIFSLSSVYCFSYYAAELKPYSLDVLVVAIFCLYLNYQRKRIAGEYSKLFMAVTLLLPLTLFFSYASFLVFWMVSYNFLPEARKNTKTLYLFLVYTALSLLALSTVYFLDLKHNFSTAGLFSYWNDYFVSTDSVYNFFKSFGEGLRKFATWWFGNIDFLKRAASFVIPFFVISLFGHGFKSLKNNRFKLGDIDALGLVIFIELLVLGVLKKYPFTGERITLFFAPFVFYFIIRGFSLLKKVRILYNFFIISYLVLVLGCGLNSFIVYLSFYG